MKEVKSFLPKVNCKISTSKLNEFFHEVDPRNRGEIGFDDFAKLYQKLIFTQNVNKRKYLKKKNNFLILIFFFYF